MRRKAIKRTLIEPDKGDKRYIRRDPAGRIKKEQGGPFVAKEP